jgi:hypothetical protein
MSRAKSAIAPGASTRKAAGLAPAPTATPLPPQGRAYFEQRLGHDFSQVRVQNGKEGAP